MSKLLKIFVGISVVLLLLIVVTFFLVSRYLTEERIKGILIPPLEEATGLKVDIGGIKRSGLAGVKVINVSFLDPKEKEEVLSSKEIKLSLQLMPLLHGELSIAELIFVEPKVFIVREKNGRFNLERYFLSKKKPPSKKEKEAPSKFVFVFQNLRVKKARISFLDTREELPPVQALLSLAAHLSFDKGRLFLEGDGTLDTLVSERPLLSELKFKVSAAQEEIQVQLAEGKLLKGKFEGHSTIKGKNIQGKIRVSGLDLHEAQSWVELLKPYFFPKLETKKLPPTAGKLDLETNFSLVQGEIKALQTNGDVDLVLADQPVLSRLKFQVTGIRNVKISVLGGELLAGNVTGYLFLRKNQRLQGKFDLKGGHFDKAREVLLALAPYLMEEKPEVPQMQGVFDLHAALSGPVTNPFMNLLFKPHPLKVSLPAYNIDLSGLVGLKRLVLSPKLDVNVNGQRMHVSGTVNLKPSVPVAHLLVTGHVIDLKRLIPEETKKEKASSPSGAPSKQPAKKQMVLPLKGQIKVRFDKVCYKLCADKVHSALDLSEQHIFLKDLSFLLAGAVNQINGQIVGLSRQPQGRLAYSIVDLNLPLVLDAFVPKSNFFTSGKITTQGVFAWRGLESAEIKKTLDGQGKARFRQVGLKEFKIVTLLASLLQMEELKKTTFQDGETLYEIRQGRMNLRGKFQAQGLRLSLTGTVGLDGTLNLNPEIFFTGRMAQLFAQRFPGASLFKVKGGYLVPLVLKGTVDEPKLSLVKVKEKIKEKAVEKLFEFLGPKQKK